MPLPLGHMSIGLVAQEISKRSVTTDQWWKTALFVGILASLPDLFTEIPCGTWISLCSEVG